MGIQCIYLDLYHMLERLNSFPDFLASLRLQELLIWLQSDLLLLTIRRIMVFVDWSVKYCQALQLFFLNLAFDLSCQRENRRLKQDHWNPQLLALMREYPFSHQREVLSLTTICLIGMFSFDPSYRSLYNNTEKPFFFSLGNYPPVTATPLLLLKLNHLYPRLPLMLHLLTLNPEWTFLLCLNHY